MAKRRHASRGPGMTRTRVMFVSFALALLLVAAAVGLRRLLEG